MEGLARHRFDAVDIGIIWSRIVSVADEMVSALIRTSFSTMVRESGDFSCMLFDARGKFLAQGACSVPSFTGTGPSTLTAILAAISADEMADGDVIITNDPWIGTGHVYDINVVKPVFHGARLIGFCLTVSHLADVGGIGFGAGAHDVYEEGFSLPPVKLYERGVISKFVLSFLESNVRFRELVLGDVYSNVASCNVGAAGLQDLLTEYAAPDLHEIADAIFALSHAAITRNLRAIPKGVFASVLPVEGIESCPEISLAVSVTINAFGFAFDFTGTSPAVDRGVNVPICYTRAFCYFCFKVLVAPGIPNNQAVLDFVTLAAPDDCILNALRPRATGARHIFGHYVAPLVFGALADALPSEVQADSGMVFQVNLRGSTQAGRKFSSIFFASGGYGAFADMDGRFALPGPSNMIAGPIEVWEEDSGCFFIRKEIRPDSGGAGTFQGGAGQTLMLRNDTGRVLEASFMASRVTLAARGFHGGSDGALRQVYVNGQVVEPKSRVLLDPGGVITMHDAGGGGFGPPGGRAAERIRADVAAGLITRHFAATHYPHHTNAPTSTTSHGNAA